MSRAPGRTRSLYIAQGEFAVTSGPDKPISTILGSCVATCLWDGEAGVGGMNHILLPDKTGGSLLADRFGINAMETLVNAVLRAGALRSRLAAKVFGGARMREGLTDAGVRNALFVKAFLEREGIPCLGESLGGTRARRLEFWPDTGRARMKQVTDALIEEAPAPAPAQDGGGALELF